MYKLFYLTIFIYFIYGFSISNSIFLYLYYFKYDINYKTKKEFKEK